MTIGALLTLVFFLTVFGLVIRRVKSPHSQSTTGSSPTQSSYKPTGTDATLTVLATSAILAASASRGKIDLESDELLTQSSATDDATASAVNPATGLPGESEGGTDVRGNPYGTDLDQAFTSGDTFSSGSGMDESFFDPLDIDW